jgi:hypothetical protein
MGSTCPKTFYTTGPGAPKKEQPSAPTHPTASGA